MKPLRERNQVLVAVWGTVLAAVVVLASMNLDRLPFVNSSSTYHADFAEADGLQSGDDVRVQGISVGEVDSVRVQGVHVDVTFEIHDNIALGGASRASIEVATVLGNVFVQVESAGPGKLAEGGTIPVTSTTVPFSLLDALQSFAHFSRRTDIPTLRRSLRTLAGTVKGIAPKDVQAALTGLATLSTTLADKQDQVSGVLRSLTRITDTLNRNSGALLQLIGQGDQFLALLRQRHAVIAQLLIDTASLGRQLSVLMDSTGAKLHTLLGNLDAVTKVLVHERDQLQQGIANLGQFSVNIANVTGSGPWLDLLSPTAIIPDNQIRSCGKSPSSVEPKPCGG